MEFSGIPYSDPTVDQAIRYLTQDQQPESFNLRSASQEIPSILTRADAINKIGQVNFQKAPPEFIQKLQDLSKFDQDIDDILTKRGLNVPKTLEKSFQPSIIDHASDISILWFNYGVELQEKGISNKESFTQEYTKHFLQNDSNKFIFRDTRETTYNPETKCYVISFKSGGEIVEKKILEQDKKWRLENDTEEFDSLKDLIEKKFPDSTPIKRPEYKEGKQFVFNNLKVDEQKNRIRTSLETLNILSHEQMTPTNMQLASDHINILDKIQSRVVSEQEHRLKLTTALRILDRAYQDPSIKIYSIPYVANALAFVDKNAGTTFTIYEQLKVVNAIRILQIAQKSRIQTDDIPFIIFALEILNKAEIKDQEIANILRDVDLQNLNIKVSQIPNTSNINFYDQISRLENKIRSLTQKRDLEKTHNHFNNIKDLIRDKNIPNENAKPFINQYVNYFMRNSSQYMIRMSWSKASNEQVQNYVISYRDDKNQVMEMQVVAKTSSDGKKLWFTSEAPLAIRTYHDSLDDLVKQFLPNREPVAPPTPGQISDFVNFYRKASDPVLRNAELTLKKFIESNDIDADLTEVQSSLKALENINDAESYQFKYGTAIKILQNADKKARLDTTDVGLIIDSLTLLNEYELDAESLPKIKALNIGALQMKVLNVQNSPPENYDKIVDLAKGLLLDY